MTKLYTVTVTLKPTEDDPKPVLNTYTEPYSSEEEAIEEAQEQFPDAVSVAVVEVLDDDAEAALA